MISNAIPMAESSSDEECGSVEFWNNWQPLSIESKGRIPSEPSEYGVRKARQITYNFLTPQSSILNTENYKFGNWIPPAYFLKSSLKNVTNVLPKTDIKQKEMETEGFSENHEPKENIQKNFEMSKKDSSKNGPSKIEAFTWGNRIQLHDVTNLKEEDFFWGVVNLGVFSHIKMWVNEYGNICCSAGGEISKIGSSEMTYISIIDPQILRKMLRISLAQWASLCEIVLETKSTLNFSAFQDFEPTGKTALEKLWFFMCKRRHFLTRQCMLVKFCGAIKCMRKFSITPKLLVQDITNVLGEPVL